MIADSDSDETGDANASAGVTLDLDEIIEVEDHPRNPPEVARPVVPALPPPPPKRPVVVVPPPAPIPFPAQQRAVEADPEPAVSEDEANDEIDSLDPQSHLDLKLAAPRNDVADIKLKLTEPEPADAEVTEDSPEQVSSIFRAALAKMRKPEPLD